MARGGGNVSGEEMRRFWSISPGPGDIAVALQRNLADEGGAALLERFDRWNAEPLDLPGRVVLGLEVQPDVRPVERRHHPLVCGALAWGGGPMGTVTLLTQPLQPVMQMRIKMNIKAADGSEIPSDVGSTINVVPPDAQRGANFTSAR